MSNKARRIPSAIAATVEKASPRVRNFVEGLAFALDGKVTNFFPCEPCVYRVQAVGDEDLNWLEASWGADVECYRFSLRMFDHWRGGSGMIGVGDVSVEAAAEGRVSVRVWLFGRVLREDG